MSKSSCVSTLSLFFYRAFLKGISALVEEGTSPEAGDDGGSGRDAGEQTSIWRLKNKTF
jgi:hypothetical protein